MAPVGFASRWKYRGRSVEGSGDEVMVSVEVLSASRDGGAPSGATPWPLRAGLELGRDVLRCTDQITAGVPDAAQGLHANRVHRDDVAEIDVHRTWRLGTRRQQVGHVHGCEATCHVNHPGVTLVDDPNPALHVGGIRKNPASRRAGVAMASLMVIRGFPPRPPTRRPRRNDRML